MYYIVKNKTTDQYCVDFSSGLAGFRRDAIKFKRRGTARVQAGVWDLWLEAAGVTDYDIVVVRCRE